MSGEGKQKAAVAPEEILHHRARGRILLGVRAAGQLAPAELWKSTFGSGISLEMYSYHFRALHRMGVLKSKRLGPGSQQTPTRYELAEHLPQSLLDAAAMEAIAEVLASISEPLADWIDKPFIDEIDQLVKAAGRHA